MISRKSSIKTILLICLIVSISSIFLFGSCNLAKETITIDDPESYTIELGGSEYWISAHLNRDFMPPSPPDGQPLSGHFRFRKSASVLRCPIGLWEVQDEVHLVHESGRKWTTNFTENDDALTIWYYTFKDGPKWEPGTTVDISFKILVTYASTEVATDKMYTLVFKDVQIERSE